MLTIDRAALEAEAQEMDDDDWSKLIAECREKFKLEDAPELEAKIEASVECGFKVLEAIAAGVAAWKKGAAAA